MLKQILVPTETYLNWSDTYNTLTTFFKDNLKSSDSRLRFFEYLRDTFKTVVTVAIPFPYEQGKVVGCWSEFSERANIEFAYYFADELDMNYKTQKYSTDGHITVKRDQQIVTFARAAGTNEGDIYYISVNGTHPTKYEGFGLAFEEFTKLLKD